MSYWLPSLSQSELNELKYHKGYLKDYLCAWMLLEPICPGEWNATKNCFSAKTRLGKKIKEKKKKTKVILQNAECLFPQYQIFWFFAICLCVSDKTRGGGIIGCFCGFGDCKRREIGQRTKRCKVPVWKMLKMLFLCLNMLFEMLETAVQSTQCN